MALDDIEMKIYNEPTLDIDYDLKVIDTIKPSNEWTIWKQNLG